MRRASIGSPPSGAKDQTVEWLIQAVLELQNASFENTPEQYVQAPLAAVNDNAIARFDGTSGQIIQGSAVTIDDSGNIAATNLVASSTAANDLVTNNMGLVVGASLASFSISIARASIQARNNGAASGLSLNALGGAVSLGSAGQLVTALGQLSGVGTATNDSAAAGYIGEVISSTVASGSAVALTSGAGANVTSISLTAGDWEVTGSVGFNPAAATSITRLEQSISQTSATVDTTAGSYASLTMAAIVPGASATAFVLPCLTQRISLASTTTIYLVARAAFTVSTLGAYGAIHARRMR